MRVPLLRYWSDPTPPAWWEWLFAPVMLPLTLLGILVMGIASVPVGFVSRRRRQRAERQLQLQLAAGRYLEWPAVEARWAAGEGTLLIEHLGQKGPIREWWVEDDLIATAPVPLPVSVKTKSTEVQLQPVLEYAAACAARYTDVATGAAKLTEVPVPLPRRHDPAKCTVVDLGGGLTITVLLPTGRKLAEKYPGGKVVTLVTWLRGPGESVLFAGDAETVLVFADAEPDVAH